MNAVLLAVATVATLSLPVETLNGNARVFPKDADTPRSIFVVTLTKAASDKGAAWTSRLLGLKSQLAASVFQVAVLEEVPRLLRSFVTSAMARQVPSGLRDHFWIAVSDSTRWREITGAVSTSQDEPHVFVLDNRDRVVWRAHGEVSEGRIAEILKLPPP